MTPVEAPLTGVEQVRQLTPDQAQRGRPVRLRGVVTFHEPHGRHLVLQDRTGGISVDVSNLTLPGSFGQLVEVEGVTGRGDRFPLIINPTLTPIGPADLPVPRPVPIRDLASAGENDNWVEVRGIVRSARVQIDGTLRLEVVDASGSVSAHVTDHAGLVFSSLVDASVRFHGVAHAMVGASGDVLRSRLLVSSPTELVVERPVPVDPYALPATPIASLAHLSPQQMAGHRLRIRAAIVVDDPQEGLLVRDDTGEVKVRPAQMIPVETGDLVDVLGFVSAPAGSPLLEHAVLRPVEANTPAERAGPRRPVSLLRAAHQIRGLTHEEAEQGYPVRLHAVVTYYDPDWAILFVQDQSGGIYVDINGQPTLPLRPGQNVEIEGRSHPGNFAPQIVEPRIRPLGPGALPPHRSVPAERLFTGQMDSQWVQVEGVVQSYRHDGTRGWLDIVAGLYRFSAQTTGIADPDVLEALVDARVQIRGACGTLFNEKKQLIGIQIFFPDLSHVSVLERGSADPFSSPVRPIDALLRFSPAQAVGRRVRVKGVTTLQRAREGLFLEDESGALFVLSPDAAHMRPGDRVEAVGFPAAEGYTPVLRDAIIRKVNAGPPPKPVTITVADAATGNYDAHLIELDAYLLDRTTSSGEQVLTLHAGRLVFNAHLQQAAGAETLSWLREGSLLRLTGICSVQANASAGSSIPRSFRLLLRASDDVVVLQSAAWWTLRHTLWAGLSMAALMVVALAWVLMLKRQVYTQTALIQRKHRDLLTAEKMASLGRLTAGIAHEMNTPLATVRAALLEMSNLAVEYGASIGDDSVTPADHRQVRDEMVRAIALADKAAEKASGFVRGIKLQTREPGPGEDVRFDARPVVEEALLLLNHAARRANCALDLRGNGAPVELRGLPGHLAQVVTNLVTNAIDASGERGGGPVRVELTSNGSGAHLRVSDEGCGIPPANLPRIFDPMFTSKAFGEGTGLGLSIVHDIVKGHFGGEIHVDSAVGRGTTFDIVLPRPDRLDRKAARDEHAALDAV